MRKPDGRLLVLYRFRLTEGVSVEAGSDGGVDRVKGQSRADMDSGWMFRG